MQGAEYVNTTLGELFPDMGEFELCETGQDRRAFRRGLRCTAFQHDRPLMPRSAQVTQE